MEVVAVVDVDLDVVVLVVVFVDVVVVAAVVLVVVVDGVGQDAEHCAVGVEHHTHPEPCAEQDEDERKQVLHERAEQNIRYFK